MTASSTISGGLLGYASDVTVADSYATGDIEGYEQVGGLVGLMSNSTLTDVYATGDVVSTGLFAGGLVGVMESSEIADAHATGEVVAIAGAAGGLVAVMATSSSVTDSYATGDVVGVGANGGFVAMACSGSSVTESFATGDVSANEFAGGFLGYYCQDAGFALSGGATMDKVYATGDVSVNQGYAGGFASRVADSTITNAYATGQVHATDYVGGFASSYENSTSSNIYARGELIIDPGTPNFGGLIAAIMNSSITNSVWDTETTGVEDSAAGTGLSTTDMKTAVTYSLLGWNFSSVWGINGTNNNSYPFLRFQGFTHDSSYTVPVIPPPSVSSGGGGGGGGSKSKKSQATTTQPTESKNATPIRVNDEVRNLILKNRAIFEAAIKIGITLPPFITAVLGASTPSTSISGLPVRDLTTGMSGADVKALQEVLIAKGYSLPAGATGLFGAQTQAALIAYQTKAGLIPAQGYFGPKTRDHMKNAGLVGLWW